LSNVPQLGADASDMQVTVLSPLTAAPSAWASTFELPGLSAKPVSDTAPVAPLIRLDRSVVAAPGIAAPPAAWLRGYLDRSGETHAQRLTANASLKVVVPRTTALVQ
jgi:hypothetical protein